MGQVLDTTNYTEPGVYVKKLYQPKLSADSDFMRIPAYVGVGPSSLFHENVAVVRGFIPEEVLSFTSVAPFNALLKFKATGEEETTTLLNSKGEEVDPRTWKYMQDEDGDYIGIQIATAAFDQSETYIVSYQSKDPAALDDTGVDNLERIVEIGLSDSGNDFTSEEYELETSIGRFAEGSQLYGSESNKGTGDIPQVTSDSKYVGPTRKYHLAIDSAKSVSLPQVLNILPGSSNEGSGLLTLGVEGWSGSVDTEFRFTVKSISADGNTVSFDWSRDNPTGSGVISIKLGFESNVAFVDGLRLSSNDLTLYRVGDTYTYSLGLRSSQQLLVSWAAEDLGGGSGELTINALNRNAVKWTAGMTLIFGSNLTNYAEGDTFNLDVESTGRIKWRYDLQGVQNVSLDDLSFDQTGNITGTRRAYFLALREPRVQSIQSIVLVDDNGGKVHLREGDYTFIEGTSYVRFAERPAGSYAQVSYLYTTSPAYGQTYYIDAFAKKDENQYNIPLFLTKDNYRTYVGYPEAGNHLGTMAEIALESVGCPQICIIQVKDSDRDGNYSIADYRTAIESARDVRAFTDMIVLGKIDALGPLVSELELRNDPFRSSETLGWFGYPVNTPVGSQQKLTGTLTHFGGKVLQVAASSNSHGCHISVANTWAKRTVTNRTGVQTQLTLDGSFIAGALAALVATFANPWETLLRRTVPGFDEVQVFNPTEIKQIGPHGFIILKQEGSVISVLDCVTHDNSAPDYRQINAMTQKQWINYTVRNRMDQAVISIVPTDQENGEMLVKNALVGILGDMAARNFIGKYQDESGAPRSIDPDRDVAVDRSSSDPTKYYMKWQCNLRYHIGRIMGLYQVDRNKLFN